MNNWAVSGKYDCHFLCICVLGDRRAYPLAREMSKEMQLTHCVNAFVDNEADMPTYGQLGCKGFIVLDAKHKVVSGMTSAFMEVRGLAFQHVEALLDAISAGKKPPPFCPGEYVTLATPPSGRAELLGAQGVVVKAEDDSVAFGFLSGPYKGKTMNVLMSMVKKLDVDEVGSDDEAPSRCGQDGCGSGQGAGCNRGEVSQSGCKPGGCSQGSCSTGPATLSMLDSEFVSASLNLVSVKVPSMDAEHTECAIALKQLSEEGSLSALENVLSCLAGHFKHEEQLFDQYGFGAHTNERLSAKKTHIEDHQRILSKLRRQLAATSGGVSAEFVREVLQDFHEHTSRYDSQYADPLSEQGAQ
mmetsp:Transcript_37531/g.104349  ORF Transcript_37531/g.104349 Transcript_37531/m.104349 type:complete len:357 (-) Transcript_37531:301-1371(-)